jgi:hypothetical protein
MSTLAEELQPILTRVTVMPMSRWSNYHLLIQHHYHMYSVDNRDTKHFVLYEKIMTPKTHAISYHMYKCLRSVSACVNTKF